MPLRVCAAAHCVGMRCSRSERFCASSRSPQGLWKTLWESPYPVSGRPGSTAIYRALNISLCSFWKCLGCNDLKNFSHAEGAVSPEFTSLGEAEIPAGEARIGG